MRNYRHWLFFCTMFFGSTTVTAPASFAAGQVAKAEVQTDAVAENMLLFQREAGGWPKAIKYEATLSDEEKAAARSKFTRIDATIDNGATTKEIKYLAKAYKSTQNPKYLAAAEKGVTFLLKAQYPDGGWPQYYPDSSLYRSQITFNDNAIVNVLHVLLDVAEGKNNLETISSAYRAPAKAAVDKGVACILKTQQKRNGKLTAWAAQYDRKTYKPAKARAYELPGIALSESVSIVNFLMRLDNPSAAVKEAVAGAVAYFDESKIKGYTTKRITDPAQQTGRDLVLVEDKDAVTWARFYELDTNKPFFCGRDGIKKYALAEIENERRAGYGWYGTWPETLLTKQYPAWVKKWGK